MKLKAYPKHPYDIEAHLDCIAAIPFFPLNERMNLPVLCLATSGGGSRSYGPCSNPPFKIAFYS
ncbi:hypothetical protein SAMN05444008_108191 [Cnuella takakiae]|uniref:Uncharacterized protein n=1 Tax=Cnuella takakiae TaxID=1302690 RepID=A0A1M5C1H4_9BACT|nr:hypothetical protein SAMN05444008_108191 [Cnuella takakiae]